ncbi:hypothetical protein HDU97_010147 [Phlyctochytrium planicorne]|nr:hypothetical protein HDU97_010147 [Phlyctochytrium planicorne]
MLPLPKLKTLTKGRSGTRSGLLGNETKESREARKAARNFPIEKKHRFANRFFQAVCAFASYYFLEKQNAALMNTYKLWTIINYNWFVSILAPMVAAAMVAQYFVPVIIHVWTSRRILALELLMDASMSVLFMACFIGEVTGIGKNCPPGTSSGCDMLNWVLAWNFLRFDYKTLSQSYDFSFIFWVAAVGIDIHSILVGFGFCKGWGGDRLEDLEMDASIRRMGRT